MRSFLEICAFAFLACAPMPAAGALLWPAGLPRYDHIVVVIEENKDFDQIIGSKAAPYLNQLANEGAVLTRMFAEEHNSQGNYFWLFSGSNQNVGFDDKVPKTKFTASNLGAALIAKGLSFKGYAQSLPAIGSEIAVVPWGCFYPCLYGRKHVPWISFANVPDGQTAESSANLRFLDFPSDYAKLPTVAFVIPDLEHDMHNGKARDSIAAGDLWLRQNLDRYYQWAKMHNGLLVVTFDENDDKGGYKGLTDPGINPGPSVDPGHDRARLDLQNRVATIIAGAHVKAGFQDPEKATHVSLLRTIEAMHGLAKSGAQPPNAVCAGIADDAPVRLPFEQIK